jgi:hypothetical protein
MEINHRIQSIRRNRKAAYSYEVNPSCGAVSVGQNGERVFVYGLLEKKTALNSLLIRHLRASINTAGIFTGHQLLSKSF